MYHTSSYIISVMRQYNCSAIEAQQYLAAPCNNAFLFNNGNVSIPRTWIKHQELVLTNKS